jgi:hypothetical protein
METPHNNPLAGFQGSLVAEPPFLFLKTRRFLKSHTVNPSLLAGEGTF